MKVVQEITSVENVISYQENQTVHDLGLKIKVTSDCRMFETVTTMELLFQLKVLNDVKCTL